MHRCHWNSQDHFILSVDCQYPIKTFILIIMRFINVPSILSASLACNILRAFSEPSFPNFRNIINTPAKFSFHKNLTHEQLPRKTNKPSPTSKQNNTTQQTACAEPWQPDGRTQCPQKPSSTRQRAVGGGWGQPRAPHASGKSRAYISRKLRSPLTTRAPITSPE